VSRTTRARWHVARSHSELPRPVLQRSATRRFCSFIFFFFFFFFSLINSAQQFFKCVLFLIFPAIRSANDLSEFQLHARIITRVFRGAERMIGYRGVRACPTMNSYFATRFSRYDHRGGGILAESRRVGRDAALCPPIPDIALCRASRACQNPHFPNTD